MHFNRFFDFFCSYAFVCCELICCEDENLLNAYFSEQSKPVMLNFFKFLHYYKGKELPTSEALYFYRILNTFLIKCPRSITQFIFVDASNFLEDIKSHITSSAIVDLVIKLLYAEPVKIADSDDSCASTKIFWFADYFEEKGFLNCLFETFCLSYTQNSPDNGLLDVPPDAAMFSQQILLSLAFHEKKSHLFVNLFRKKSNIDILLKSLLWPILENVVAGPLTDEKSFISIGRSFSSLIYKESLVMIVDFLKTAFPLIVEEAGIVQIFEVLLIDENYCQLIIDRIHSFEQNHFQLGIVRLKLFEFLSILPLLKSKKISSLFIEKEILKFFTKHFFAFERNNFFHLIFTSLIRTIVKNKDTLLIEDLICKANILKHIIEAYRKTASNKVLPFAGSSKIGYMGHLSQICDEICRMQDELRDKIPPSVQKALNNREWKEVLVSYYAEAKHHESCFLGEDPTDEEIEASKKGSRFEVPPAKSLFFSAESLESFGFESLEQEQMGRFLISEISRMLPSKFSSFSSFAKQETGEKIDREKVLDLHKGSHNQSNDDCIVGQFSQSSSHSAVKNVSKISTEEEKLCSSLGLIFKTEINEDSFNYCDYPHDFSSENEFSSSSDSE